MLLNRDHYHSADRSHWDNLIYKIKQNNDIPIGIELEVYYKDIPEDEDTDNWDVDINNMTIPESFLLEEDGSLNDDWGLEVISPPISLQDALSDKGQLARVVKVLLDNGFIGWDAGAGYGMHINIDRASFNNNEHIAKFILAINNAQDFSELIAGRKERSYARYWQKTTENIEETFDDCDKYSAVNLKDDRLEVRIFRSTLKWESVKKNIEYVKAIYDFTLPEGSLEVCMRPSKLITFIFKHADRYPNLVSFLKKKKVLSSENIKKSDGSESCA